MSFAAGNSLVTLRWCSEEVKTPCSSGVSLCTDPCWVSRFSEANPQCLWRGWASQGPYHSNPCSYEAARASPHPPVLHLEVSAPSLLADCRVMRYKQAWSGLLIWASSSKFHHLEKCGCPKKKLSPEQLWISYPEVLMVRLVPTCFKVRFILSISSSKMQHHQACVVQGVRCHYH